MSTHAAFSSWLFFFPLSPPTSHLPPPSLIPAPRTRSLTPPQVHDVSRVCNAVATGDLTQKITVPVQGDFMVQLSCVLLRLSGFVLGGRGGGRGWAERVLTDVGVARRRTPHMCLFVRVVCGSGSGSSLQTTAGVYASSSASLESDANGRRCPGTRIDLARDVIDEQVQATTLGLQYLQIGAKKAALKELWDRKDAKYQAALAEFNKIDAEFEKTKESTRTLLAESKELLSALPDELREEYQATEAVRLAHEKAVQAVEKAGEEVPEPGEDVDLRSMEELETELEKQEANLEMNMNTNPGVVEQYEKRKRDIEALEVAIEGKQRPAHKIEKKIKTARQPALQSLVTSIGKKFSAAFDRIGCAGEIRVREEEAYENWAIDILVKFRDTEKLQLLTGQRQSGGERSLTTILYLMSLTEEARAPFLLVDEINQGMDRRAERMVHNSMVDVACKEDSAQYFLITPTLLPDLENHRRMKVLCVNNGEWLTDESGLGNMMAMINGFVAKNPGAGRA
ncbi:hypothetical protein C8F04DRAFT_1273230 [Mycena alexandri]|uniref:Structural maintenance of chromosomes protein 5 n=1 Tax=Mycena alexandri TaxID=1745969 RepID=A0AAD6S7U5_9AGAR|nr:hypothetical protein C8F04DRAFT_1273230 [Mycena alexandri]